MPATLLSQFLLPIDLEGFVDLFWENSEYFQSFLSKYLEDLSVDVGAWESTPLSSPSASNIQVICKTRHIRSYHPSRVSFPGLPSHAESLKSQTMTYTKGSPGHESQFVLTETNTFRGIPYADYFSVNTEWIVKSRKQASNNQECSVDIYLEVMFYKSTWLQGTIESNTRAELITVYEKWQQVAKQHLKSRQNISSLHLSSLPPNKSISPQYSQSNNNNNNTNTNQSQNQDSYRSRDIESNDRQDRDDSDKHFLTIDEDESLGHLISYVSEGNIASRFSSRNLDGKKSSNGSSIHEDYSYTSDDELLFYDCEDGGENRDTYASSKSSRNRNNNPTPQELHDLYGNSGKGSIQGSIQGSNRRSIHSLSNLTGIEEEQSSRALAVNVVETIIVLAQFSYWKAHRLYMYDLKELFNINPSDVISRIFNSFVPGWHALILQRPDMYGPLLAVFMLPQALLLNMDTSRHGCSQSSVLGNATIVSICLWCGLSSLYRLLTFVIAPTIEMKHCLSMLGYSFFAWNVALICSYPLERYHGLIGLPVALPIVLFGIPAAVAQGFMFWEHTPASSLTLQPASFPSSLQIFAQNNSRWLQKVLWAVPKILAFVIVSGTHYQFLWYVARVFLPGRKQQCELSALMQPAQYADILTQKELRKYAVMLVSGKREDDA